MPPHTPLELRSRTDIAFASSWLPSTLSLQANQLSGLFQHAMATVWTEGMHKLGLPQNPLGRHLPQQRDAGGPMPPRANTHAL